MTEPLASSTKANAVSRGLFIASLGVLYYLNLWWPGILISLWLLVGVKQFIRGEFIQFLLTTAVLIGLFMLHFYHTSLAALIPLFFILGGGYIAYRELHSEDK